MADSNVQDYGSGKVKLGVKKTLNIITPYFVKNNAISSKKAITLNRVLGLKTCYQSCVLNSIFIGDIIDKTGLNWV